MIVWLMIAGLLVVWIVAVIAGWGSGLAHILAVIAVLLLIFKLLQRRKVGA